jgi:hypothetical protein
MKLKLKGGGFENYTGQMGVVYFENGLSKFDVNPNDAIRIAGSIGAEWENGAPANVGDIYTQNMNTPAPSVEQQGGMSLLQGVVGIVNADDAMRLSESVANSQMWGGDTVTEPSATPVQASVIQPETTAAAELTTSSTGYTAESLAEIADQSGIAGLREIAAQFEVTGNSIAMLIERILKKQG